MPALDAALAEKIPPQNLEAEESVLGAALMDRDAIDRSLEILVPEDFYRPSHRKLFDAIRELNAKNEAVDLVTVTELLRQRGDLDAIGGSSFVSSLTDRVPSSANVEYYAKIVKDKSRLRRLIAACQNIISTAYQHRDEASLVVDTAENSILEVGREEGTRKITALSDLMGGVIEKIEEYRKREGHITGLATGFKRLDEMTTGLQKGEMIVVGGRPGMGKTAFCVNIARNVAVELKKPVALFSLEMTSHQLAMRLMCSEQRINSHRVRAGRLENHELGRLTLAASRLYEAPLYIDDTPRLDIQTLRAKVRRLWKDQKIEMVVIDYLQLLDSEKDKENRQQEISEISRGLKAIAKELNIPVLVASQLARASEKRGDNTKPRLSDLRESGAIEQDADVVILIYRKNYYDKDNPDKTADIEIAKQRSGPTGEFQLIFNGEYTRFDELEQGQEGGE